MCWRACLLAVTILPVVTQAEAIQILTSILRSERADVDVGAGLDDVGVIKFAGGRLAVTVDFTNFRPLGAELGVSSLRDRGYLLITHNVSDLIASGVIPIAAVVALGLPAPLEKDEIRALADGIRMAADECGVAVIGGDTKEAPCLVLNATLFGRVGVGGHWARTGARPGDLLFLSGNIGGVSAAALALSKGADDYDIRDESKSVLTRPQLPLVLATKLRDAGIRVAAIDISDGLGMDAHHLADASDVGLEIYSETIPLHPLVHKVAALRNLEPGRLAFGFGGDGQFLFAVEPEHEALAVTAGGTKIGRVLASGRRKLITVNGESALPGFGHEDFTGEPSIERLLRAMKQKIA